MTEHGSQLEIMNLTGCPELTVKDALAIGHNCPALMAISCHYSDGTAMTSTAGCSNLKSIIFASGQAVTNAALRSLGQNSSALMTIVRTHNKKITNAGVAVLTKRCTVST